MEKKQVNSVIPIYSIGLFWLIYAIIFPLYKGIHYIIAILLSAVIYFIVKKIAPKKYIMVEKQLIAHTNNQRLNEVIDEANKNISEIRKLNAAIADESVSKKIDEIEEVTIKIFDHVIKNPDNISSIRRFISYYLPTTVKLLTTYEELDKQKAQTQNISNTMNKINGMLSTIVEAFHKQLDSLFEYTAIDVASEISVMEDILASEGLTEGERFKTSDDVQTTLKL